MSRIKITQAAEGKEVPTEIIAGAITSMSEGIKNLRAGPLNDKALYLLIQQASPNVGSSYPTRKVTQSEIKAVFEGIENLEKTFLKKRK